MALTEDERDYIEWLNSIEFVDEDGNVLPVTLEPEDDADDDQVDIEWMANLMLKGGDDGDDS
jgi:hypothetical protein